MNKQKSSGNSKNQANTIGDFLSEELKKKIKDVVKKKDTSKENNQKAVGYK
jgi:hypothetical protein